MQNDSKGFEIPSYLIPIQARIREAKAKEEAIIKRGGKEAALVGAKRFLEE